MTVVITRTAITCSAAGSSDNISPVDRSHLPAGMLDRADGTAWMTCYYSIAMLTIAVTLADRNPVYEDMVVKFASPP